MKLVCNDLVTTLETEIRLLGNKRIHIAGIYPYLIMFNAPSGTFTLSLKQGATTLFSKNFTSADIKTSLATTDNYAHAFYAVIPTALLPLETGVYTIKLASSGYTFSAASYLGWISQFEDIQNEMEYTPTNDSQNPLALRIKIFKEGIA